MQPVSATPTRANTLFHEQLQNPPAKLLRCRGDPALHPTPPLQDILTGDQPELSQLHPNASHISRLWQTYVERVDPLIKFTHVPTLQERILNASWEGPANAHKPLVATLFAVYTLAVTSMSSAQCEASFGEPRSTLMMRYRVAAVRVLVAADVFTTRDFEVLQALLLFLFSEPESALTLSLLSVAVKMGEVIGLQRASSDPKLSFFDREMRIRLWWQLRGLEHRANMAFTSSPSKSPTESGDLRLPLNVNDVDLHPDMVEPPVEHSGPTEMICALMRFQVIKWVRSSSAGAVLFERIRRGPVPGRAPLDAEDEAIGALEEIYEEKLFRRSDAHIPLHGLVRSIARGAIASLRFRLHHPRGRASVRSGEVHMSRDELDMLFDSAVACLEATMACSQTKFSRHLVSLIRPPLGMDPYIYMISDLRQRCSGVRADLAWSLVEHLYSEHPELINDTATPLFAALGELTLEAWDARSRALKRELRKLGPTPLFIQLLRDVNEFKNQDRPQLPIAMDPCSSDELGSLDMHDLDWNYWNGFLQP